MPSTWRRFFGNLVEAHVLEMPIREHRAVPHRSQWIRVRAHLLEAQACGGRESFCVFAVNLISASESGQLTIRELIKAHLRRIEHDTSGLAARLYPFTRQNNLDQPRIVVIDPLISFGRPTIAGTNSDHFRRWIQGGD